MVTAHPAAAAPTSTSSSSGVPPWVWALVGLVVLGGIVVLVRRRDVGDDEAETG
jgi:MYXO-CTERM domain-containing protein